LWLAEARKRTAAKAAGKAKAAVAGAKGTD
jgi:hypothetical protein